MPNRPKRCWLIAGPDGVGKTTYAFKNVPAVSGSINFVNLDEIARGLSPLAPRHAEAAAARIALKRAEEFIARGEVFTMETTLSGRAHLGLMREARVQGLLPSLLYFSARTAEICLERVARRVAEGGHDVAEPVVRRRFDRSLANLPLYAAEADLWRVYEASGVRPCLAAEGRGRELSHADQECLGRAHAAVQAFAGALPARLGG